MASFLYSYVPTLFHHGFVSSLISDLPYSMKITIPLSLLYIYIYLFTKYRNIQSMHEIVLRCFFLVLEDKITSTICGIYIIIIVYIEGVWPVC